MSKLRSWLLAIPGATYVPLFETDDALLVRTAIPPSGKTRICRSQAMESAMLNPDDQFSREPPRLVERPSLHMRQQGTMRSHYSRTVSASRNE